MNRLSVRFLGAVLLQFALLGSVIGYKQYTVWTGVTVLLQVQPLDPRSPFRGDYVHLNYDISTLDPSALGGTDYPYGAVYVELAPGSASAWQAVAVYEKRRKVADGHVLIKGKVAPQRFTSPGRFESVRVTYGIEDVFVPEGSGRAVETAGDRVTVEVKVDRFGNAVPRRILLDGRPFKLKRS